MEKKKCSSSSMLLYLVFGTAIGTSLGLSLGAASDNVAIGMGMGPGIGAALGILFWTIFRSNTCQTVTCAHCGCSTKGRSCASDTTCPECGEPAAGRGEEPDFDV